MEVENEGEESAYRARAWASTTESQVSIVYGQPVSFGEIYAGQNRTDHDRCPKLEELRQAADSSKWSLFCQLADSAKVAYQTKQNQYGETTKKGDRLLARSSY
ncbi:hypothetical protein O9929_01385 [Vibrio lentus]|nr:hypothetical protein [Vibrio lentus]